MSAGIADKGEMCKKIGKDGEITANCLKLCLPSYGPIGVHHREYAFASAKTQISQLPKLLFRHGHTARPHPR